MDESDDRCVRCQYELRGIANDQPCPECGLLAERSRGLTGQLRDTDPAYLRKLSVGVWVMLLSALLPPVWLALLTMTDLVYFHSRRRGFLTSGHFFLSGFIVAAILFLLGVLLTTAVESRHKHARRWLRIAIRLMTIAMLVGVASSHLSEEIERSLRISLISMSTGIEGTVLRLLTYLRVAILLLAVLPLPVLLFWHLSGIGKRLLSRQIAEHSVIVGIGLSGSIVFVLTLYMIAAYGSQIGFPELPRRSQIPIISLTLCFTSCILFGLWTIYLLIRFAIAFWIESHAMRQLWRDADRSIPAG